MNRAQRKSTRRDRSNLNCVWSLLLWLPSVLFTAGHSVFQLWCSIESSDRFKFDGSTNNRTQGCLTGVNETVKYSFTYSRFSLPCQLKDFFIFLGRVISSERERTNENKTDTVVYNHNIRSSSSSVGVFHHISLVLKCQQLLWPT